MARRFNCTVAITTALGFGFPDWVMGVRGITVLVERKNRTGKMRQSQIDFARNWNGGPLIKVQDGIDLQALITSRDVLAHCAARDLRVILGFRERVHYIPTLPPDIIRQRREAFGSHTAMGPGVPECSD